MNATGVLRKIDELGRIVIPKEIRDNLRMQVGESLDIYVHGNEIVLKKYSRLNKITELSKVFVKSLVEITGGQALITDRDKVIAVSSNCKPNLLGKVISDKLLKIINKREFVPIKGSNDLEISEYKAVNGNYLIIPIVYTGDCIGLIILIKKEEITEKDEINANFGAKWISNYFG